MNNTQHFYWRAGFGPTANTLLPAGKWKASALFDHYWQQSKQPVQALTVVQPSLEATSPNMMTGNNASQEAIQKERREKLQQQSREAIKQLNLTWLNEMVTSKAQLREKIALFWHGHFACRNLNSMYQQQLLNVVRSGALGSFADLLTKVSKSAAMLAFLNNQQNKKQQPNENFAREVMELFTLGRGHYTEQDVKEAARAFTGWGFDVSGSFVFRKKQHDTGSKTIFGKTGNFNGDDVLAMLLQQPQTAQFIATKLYRFLVNDQVNETHIAWLAKRFYDSGYEMQQLLSDILTADWFYNETNQGAQVKSPVLLWVGMRRMLPMQLENPDIQILLQRALGQILLYPPTVAGWPGGTSWIDSSSLLLRMRLPQLVALAEPFELSAPDDDDVQMGKMQQALGKKNINRFKLKGDIAWEPLIAVLHKYKKSELVPALCQHLLQCPHQLTSTIEAQVAPGLPESSLIKQTTLLVMATPAYQLC